MAINEQHPEPLNPLGIDGIEFVEYATTQLVSDCLPHLKAAAHALSAELAP